LCQKYVKKNVDLTPNKVSYWLTGKLKGICFRKIRIPRFFDYSGRMFEQMPPNWSKRVGLRNTDARSHKLAQSWPLFVPFFWEVELS